MMKNLARQRDDLLAGLFDFSWPTWTWVTNDIDTYLRVGEKTEDGIKFMLPGFGKEHVKVILEEGSLKINAEKDGKHYNYEYSVGIFDGDIEAKMEYGILTIKLPQPKKNIKEITVT